MDVTVGHPASLVDAIVDSLRGYWAKAEPYQRFLYSVAALFAGSAALHAVVFVVDDRAWDALGSWRQPLLFSFAFFFVLPSLAWVMSFLPVRLGLGWAVSGTLGVAALGAVFLIALQAWRGERAFFPEEGRAFDQAVWIGMQIGVGLIVLAIVVEALWVLRSLDAPPRFRWAIRTGLLVVIAGLTMGGVMVAEGVSQEAGGEHVDSPVVFGEAGLVVVPHLLSLHGLLVLSVLAWLLSFTALQERRRVNIVQAATVGYVALIAVSLVQALDGRAPLDLTGFVAVLFWTSLALCTGVFVATLAWLRPSARVQGS
jgi:hypothetical protein